MFLFIEMMIDKTVDTIKNVRTMKNVNVLNFSVDRADETVNDLYLFEENFICKNVFVLLLFFKVFVPLENVSLQYFK